MLGIIDLMSPDTEAIKKIIPINTQNPLKVNSINHCKKFDIFYIFEFVIKKWPIIATLILKLC